MQLFRDPFPVTTRAKTPDGGGGGVGLLSFFGGHRCVAGNFDYYPIAKPQTDQICDPYFLFYPPKLKY